MGKSKFYKTAGWLTVSVGLYLLAKGYGIEMDLEDVVYRHPVDDNIIDADFTILD